MRTAVNYIKNVHQAPETLFFYFCEHYIAKDFIHAQK